MAERNILVIGDEQLKKISRPVETIDQRIKDILEDMVETMRNAPGVGLAAPQIGVSRRMFVAEPEPGRLYYMINPEILETEGEDIDFEGCLSVPGKLGIVARPHKIKMKAQDITGAWNTYEFEGFDARVMLHENDHLDGVIYVERADRVMDEEELMEEIGQKEFESDEL